MFWVGREKEVAVGSFDGIIGSLHSLPNLLEGTVPGGKGLKVWHWLRSSLSQGGRSIGRGTWGSSGLLQPRSCAHKDPGTLYFSFHSAFLGGFHPSELQGLMPVFWARWSGRATGLLSWGVAFLFRGRMLSLQCYFHVSLCRIISQSHILLDWAWKGIF